MTSQITNTPVAQVGNWDLLGTLGSGTCFKVMIGRNKKDKTLAAVKHISADSSSEDLTFYSSEHDALRHLDHPNIIKLLESSECMIYEPRPHSHSLETRKKVKTLVLELAQAGDLYDFVVHSGGFSDDVSRYFFHQIVSAVAHCHNSGFSHGDLKLNNILLTSGFDVKVSDFGFARRISDDADQAEEYIFGTPMYSAPEIRASRDYDKKAADIFALGVTLFVMRTGHLPFIEATPNDTIFSMIYDGQMSQFWKFHNNRREIKKLGKLPQCFTDLVGQMLCFDPKQRITINDIKHQFWFRGPSTTQKEIKSDLSEMKRTIEAAKRGEVFVVEDSPHLKFNSVLNEKTEGNSSSTSEGERAAELSIHTNRF